ncbi:hypothetical protein Cch01nite_42220 [Cellulomonas chitinilytica]|uniref:Uncharacterized protein n=1 Tax=Cellulomonas chitinilytica TaxID=398759 RepID=A0A919U1S9_9CELL|nr:hypothetical protein [Cellulomonas chitinilytica]GIG23498.1 hypothetical protein Cch01nite_42220 [Cellulomonas chitinilytica]
MRYLCAERGCLRGSVPVAETICAACGSRTRGLEPTSQVGMLRRMVLVAAVTALPWLLMRVSLGLVVLVAGGALAAWWATRRSRAEGQRTPVYWIVFAGALVLTPVAVLVVGAALFVVTGFMGLHP